MIIIVLRWSLIPRKLVAFENRPSLSYFRMHIHSARRLGLSTYMSRHAGNRQVIPSSRCQSKDKEFRRCVRPCCADSNHDSWIEPHTACVLQNIRLAAFTMVVGAPRTSSM
jgi:hypothetical protein